MSDQPDPSSGASDVTALIAEAQEWLVCVEQSKCSDSLAINPEFIERLIAALAAEKARADQVASRVEGIRRFASGEQVGASTNIADEPSYGYGDLDFNGFWEYPVPPALVEKVATLRAAKEQAEQDADRAIEKYAEVVKVTMRTKKALEEADALRVQAEAEQDQLREEVAEKESEWWYENDQRGKAERSLTALREQVEQEIEKNLDWINRESYGIDVREKFKTANAVIDTVVSLSTATHALLFVRKVLRESTLSTPAAPQEAPK